MRGEMGRSNADERSKSRQNGTTHGMGVFVRFRQLLPRKPQKSQRKGQLMERTIKLRRLVDHVDSLQPHWRVFLIEAQPNGKDLPLSIEPCPRRSAVKHTSTLLKMRIFVLRAHPRAPQSLEEPSLEQLRMLFAALHLLHELVSLKKVIFKFLFTLQIANFEGGVLYSYEQKMILPNGSPSLLEAVLVPDQCKSP